MEPEEAYGRVLRAARKRRGLSQEKLALDAGVERNYISLIELGRNSPRLRVQFKLSAVLAQSPSALIVQAEELLHAGQKKGRGRR